MNKMFNGTWAIRLICVLSFCVALTFEASAQEQTCSQLLIEADQYYERGDFDQTIAIVDRCLASDSMTETERRNGYRLKGLSYIGKGLEVDARESIRRLLQLVPNYEPDPVMDPPNFVEMITEMREEMDEEAAPAQEETVVTEPEVQAQPPVATPQPSTRKRRGGGKKWLIGGLGVAAAGGLVAILASGGGGSGGGGNTIAEPPPLP